MTNVSASPHVFYPLLDGYRDSTTIAATLSEASSATRIELVRDHAVRRILRLGALPAGAFTRAWDGRRADGTLMPAGTYRYRFVATDTAGNYTTRSGGSVELRRGSNPR